MAADATTPPASTGNPLDEPHLRQFKAYLAELNKESERGEVLVSATVLDDQLQKCLSSLLVDHPDVNKLVDGFNAPLGTFSARILAAFALGIISEQEYRKCSTLRKIRNQFAHSLTVSFETQSVADMCKKLTFAIPTHDGSSIDARGQFTSAAVALILSFVNRPHHVSSHRLSTNKWPS